MLPSSNTHYMHTSLSNAVDESEARVTALAKEVVGMIRTSVGNSAFATAWADVRAHVMEVGCSSSSNLWRCCFIEIYHIAAI